MIKEAYVSFEVAKLLKEKGFDVSCHQKYDDEGYLSFNDVGYVNSEKPCDDFYALAPTQQMAMAWLREKNISIEPSALNAHLWAYTIYKLFNKNVKELHNDGVYESYEEAVEAALKYYLENLFDYGSTREDLCSC